MRLSNTDQRVLLLRSGGLGSSQGSQGHGRVSERNAIVGNQAHHVDVDTLKIYNFRHTWASDYLDATSDAEPTPTKRADHGHGKVWFRLDPHGTFFAATAVSCLIALLLLGATIRLRELDRQTGAALLLTLPVLALGYLARAGEHSFTTRLLVGIRVAALIIGACALIVAWILAGGVVENHPAVAGPYACKAHLMDLNVHPAPHRSWKTTADPDITQLDCGYGKPTPGSTADVKWARTTAIVATSVAGGLALWLFVGWLYTRFRRSGMLPEAARVKRARKAAQSSTGS